MSYRTGYGFYNFQRNGLYFKGQPFQGWSRTNLAIPWTAVLPLHYSQTVLVTRGIPPRDSYSRGRGAVAIEKLTPKMRPVLPRCCSFWLFLNVFRLGKCPSALLTPHGFVSLSSALVPILRQLWLSTRPKPVVVVEYTCLLRLFKGAKRRARQKTVRLCCFLVYPQGELNPRFKIESLVS